MKHDRFIYQKPIMEILILCENDVVTDIVQASGTGNDNNIAGSNYNDFFNGF